MIQMALLCGGKGTRLSPLTDQLPKSLIGVNGQPFILHQLALLKRKGITNVVLLTGHLGQMIHDVVGNGSQFGMTVEYSCDPDPDQPLGTAGAVRQALHLLGDRFFVLYGDSYLDCDYALIERFFLLNGMNVSTWWQSLDYGLSAFLAEDLRVIRHADLTDVRQQLHAMDRLLYYPMPQRYEEIGSRNGLERIRVLIK